MSEIIIKIDWPYFLGIIGTVTTSLVVIAWQSGSRFSKIETAIDWLKDAIKDIKVDNNNKIINAFKNASPVNLTERGKQLLTESGLKKYINDNIQNLMEQCQTKEKTNSYETQEFIFNLFDDLILTADIDKKMKDYAYKQGISTDIVRRTGAIYFRDICLNNFNMKIEDIDNAKKI